MAKPKEARTIIDKKEKLEIQKHYLELRQQYARALEDRNAVGALLGRNEVEPEYFEDEDLLENKENKVKELEGEINELEKDETVIPERFVESDNFDREFLDLQLNKIRSELMEPIPQKKAEFPTIALRDSEREMIKKNFPIGLFPKGSEVKYEGDQWQVAGYDGYTGRGILKRQLGPGQTEYIFAERIPLYLENRVKSKDLGKDDIVSLDQMTKQHGLNQVETQAMSDDDLFDDERVQAEQDARKPEKLRNRFKNWVREKYEKVKKEIATLPSDIRDIYDTEREPFKATIKDMKEELTGLSSKATFEDINKDLTKGAEKFDQWAEGRRQAVEQAITDIRKANEFRAFTKEIAKDFSKWAKFFEDEMKLRKWVDSDFDPMSVDDQTLEEYYNKAKSVNEYVNNEYSEYGRVEFLSTLEKKKEVFHDVFDPLLRAKIATMDRVQENIVTHETQQLRKQLLNIDPKLTDDDAELERRLGIFREELNKEFGRLRQFQVAINTRRMARVIRSLLDKDYWQDYVYGPLKIFQKNSKKEQPETEEREVVEL